VLKLAVFEKIAPHPTGGQAVRTMPENAENKRYPQNLWITMWMTCLGGASTVELTCLPIP
jgi:hypothetical protein